MKLFIALLFISQGSFAQNVSFRPYEFTQTGLMERADLKKLVSKTVIVVPQGNLANLQKIDLPPIRHSIDKDLLSFYQSFMRDSLVPEAAADKWCADLEASLQLPLPTFPTSCSPQLATFNLAISNLRAACRKINRPEEYFFSLQKPGTVDEKDLKSMEGLIRTAGEALNHISYPKGLLSSVMVSDVRKIIRKIRLPDLNKSITDATNALSTSANSVTSVNCFKSTTEKNLWAESVQAWSKSISTIVTRLADLEATGKKQSEEDLKRVLATGRKRNVLPINTITDKERILLTSFVSGVYWRLRGGGLIEYPPGTLETRRLYTQIPFATFTEFNCGTECKSLGASIGSAQKSALQLKGWGDFLNLGRKPGGKDRFDDFLHLVERGIYQVEGTNKILKSAGYDPTPLLVGSTQMGACYDLGYEKMNGIDIGMNLQLPYTRFIEFATEYGEFCFGFVLGKGLSETLLNGRK